VEGIAANYFKFFMRNHKPILSLVSPCYNEQEVLLQSVHILAARLTQLIDKQIIHNDSFICLVDDGSNDDTWQLIENCSQKYHCVSALKLMHNVGHQNALMAGLNFVADKCDCSISLDIDLQDDLSTFETMLELYEQGNHLVFGVKKNRQKDSILKRMSARLYYRLLQLMQIKSVYNHADFRLYSKKILQLLQDIPERNLYLRGLCANLNCKVGYVEYDIKERQAGTSKYTLGKMLSLAWDGISSFSIVPLRAFTFIGFFVFLISVGLSIYVLASVLFSDSVVPGWASTVLPIYFLGGIQLLGLGILGEYIAKVYLEVKKRPRYIIEEKITTQKAPVAK
jgi:glycosyltransferase involved in cell wall biosynthesis